MSLIGKLLSRLLPELEGEVAETYVRQLAESFLDTTPGERMSVFAPMLERFADDPMRNQAFRKIVTVLDNATRLEQEAVSPIRARVFAPGYDVPVSGRQAVSPYPIVEAPSPESIISRSDLLFRERSSGAAQLPPEFAAWLEEQLEADRLVHFGERLDAYGPQSGKAEDYGIPILNLSQMFMDPDQAHRDAIRSQLDNALLGLHEEIVGKPGARDRPISLSDPAKRSLLKLFGTEEKPGALQIINDPSTPIRMTPKQTAAFIRDRGSDTGVGNNNLLRILFEAGVPPGGLRFTEPGVRVKAAKPIRRAFQTAEEAEDEVIRTVGINPDRAYRDRVTGQVLDWLGVQETKQAYGSPLQRAFHEFLEKRRLREDKTLFKALPSPAEPTEFALPTVGAVDAAFRVLSRKLPGLRLRDIFDPSEAQKPFVELMIPPGAAAPQAEVLFTHKTGMMRAKAPIFPIHAVGANLVPRFQQGDIVLSNTPRIADRPYVVIDEVAFLPPAGKRNFRQALVLSPVDADGIAELDEPLFVAIPQEGKALVRRAKEDEVVPFVPDPVGQARKLAKYHTQRFALRPEDLGRPGMNFFKIYDEDGRLLDATFGRAPAIEALASNRFVQKLPIGVRASFEIAPDVDVTFAGRIRQAYQEMQARNIADLAGHISNFTHPDRRIREGAEYALAHALAIERADLARIFRGRITKRDPTRFALARMYEFESKKGGIFKIHGAIVEDIGTVDPAMALLEARVTTPEKLGKRVRAQLFLGEKTPQEFRALAKIQAFKDLYESITAEAAYPDFQRAAQVILQGHSDLVLKTMSFRQAVAGMAGADARREVPANLMRKVGILRAEAEQDRAAFATNFLSHHIKRLERKGYKYVNLSFIEAEDDMPQIFIHAQHPMTGDTTRFRVGLVGRFADEFFPDQAEANRIFEETVEKLTGSPMPPGVCGPSDLTPE